MRPGNPRQESRYNPRILTENSTVLAPCRNRPAPRPDREVTMLSLSLLGGPFLTALLAAAGPADAPLVVRDRVQLRLAGAEAILSAAKAKAAQMKLKVNIAVVDDG